MSLDRRLSKLEESCGDTIADALKNVARVKKAIAKHPELLNELELLAVAEDSEGGIAALPPERLKELYDAKKRLTKAMEEDDPDPAA